MSTRRAALTAALLVGAFSLLLAALSSSCTPTDPGSALNPKKRLDEAAIVALQSQVSADPRMAGASVEVSGVRNQVVLTGSATDEQKKLAEELVKKYNPSYPVDNQIKVTGGVGPLPSSDYGR